MERRQLKVEGSYYVRNSCIYCNLALWKVFNVINSYFLALKDMQRYFNIFSVRRRESCLQFT